MGYNVVSGVPDELHNAVTTISEMASHATVTLDLNMGMVEIMYTENTKVIIFKRTIQARCSMSTDFYRCACDISDLLRRLG